MEAALPEYQGVPVGDEANQQFGKTLFPIVVIALKFSDHGNEETGPHRVLKEVGPPHALLSETLHTDRTQT